jgi:prolyl-tRNA synthetase
MRLSRLVSKTAKSVSAEAESINAKLLLQGGFVHQEMAGVYSWMPLGLKVLRNVERVIREEMNAIGAQEILMSALQPKENWLTTERWDAVDVLFKVPSQTGKEYGLGPTHEEIVTPLVRDFVRSYKDLPVAVYQIQTKFRDELRAKSGVLRGREFGMKDLYSFHATRADLEQYYEVVKDAYLKVFKRLGLNAKVVEASGGSFTKKFSHEFQVLTSAGEDKILTAEKTAFAQNEEVATMKPGDIAPDTGEVLDWHTGVEVGNIFDLGTRFSEPFEVAVTLENGERVHAFMGCYGIGTTRLVGTIVEACHDESGIVWPKEAAPFEVQMVSLFGRDEAGQALVREASERLYADLQAAQIEVLWDERADLSPGAKFADADLLGMPVRILVSEKSLATGEVEWKDRATGEVQMVPMVDVIKKLRA